MYRRLIVEGAWWDFVDDVATNLIRSLVLAEPKAAWPEIDTWIGDDDMWLRRSAIICQVGAKGSTDSSRLFAFCEARIDEKEFFIRKAIGWAFRETPGPIPRRSLNSQPCTETGSRVSATGRRPSTSGT